MGVFRLEFGDILRLGELEATSWSPWPRIFTDSAARWKRGAAELIAILAAENESTLPQRPTPPRERPAALIAKGHRRWIIRRAVDAIGVVAAHAACHLEILFPARSRRADGPRADDAPQMVPLVRSVFRRPDYWASAKHFPNAEVSAITTDVYI